MTMQIYVSILRSNPPMVTCFYNEQLMLEHLIKQPYFCDFTGELEAAKVYINSMAFTEAQSVNLANALSFALDSLYSSGVIGEGSCV
jgi:hypothetical protein